MAQIATDKNSFLSKGPNVSKTERVRQDIEINNLAKVKTLTLFAVTWLLPAIEAGSFKKRVPFNQDITKIYSWP